MLLCNIQRHTQRHLHQGKHSSHSNTIQIGRNILPQSWYLWKPFDLLWIQSSRTLFLTTLVFGLKDQQWWERSWRGWLDSCIKVKLCLCILEICTGDMLHSHCGGRACLCTSFVFTPWINAFLFSTAWLQSYYREHLLPGVKRSKRHICEQVNSHKHK